VSDNASSDSESDNDEGSFIFTDHLSHLVQAVAILTVRGTHCMINCKVLTSCHADFKIYKMTQKTIFCHQLTTVAGRFKTDFRYLLAGASPRIGYNFQHISCYTYFNSDNKDYFYTG